MKLLAPSLIFSQRSGATPFCFACLLHKPGPSISIASLQFLPKLVNSRFLFSFQSWCIGKTLSFLCLSFAVAHLTQSLASFVSKLMRISQRFLLPLLRGINAIVGKYLLVARSHIADELLFCFRFHIARTG